jgi:hypothetical protein
MPCNSASMILFQIIQSGSMRKTWIAPVRLERIDENPHDNKA